MSGVVNLQGTTFKLMIHAALDIMNEENVSGYMWSWRTKEIVTKIILLCSLVQMSKSSSIKSNTPNILEDYAKNLGE